ncbi:hypothetical protein CF335_g7580 [Tilletia laevis]|nr:hypothetical protein CF335_g7580 [Tilletia laevis]
MPGCSASHLALSPCYTSTSVYALHRGGAYCSGPLTSALTSQGGNEDAPSGGNETADGAEDKTGSEEEGVSEAHRALSQERMVIRWHQRLAHMSFGSIAKLIGMGVEGLKHLNKSAALRLVDREDRCDACAISNLKEASFKTSTSRAEHRGDLAHCDLPGPYTATQSTLMR